MSRYVAAGLVAAVVAAFALQSVQAQDDEMVDNPLYKAWSKFKKGSKAVEVERTELGKGGKSLVPGGVDSKEITYTLVKVNDKAVVVKTVVKERDFLSYIESAPTLITYPAKVKKSYLKAILDETGAKVGEAKVKVKGGVLACKTIAGKFDRGGQQIEFKRWYSSKIPGGVVKRIRITREGGKVIGETMTEIRSYKAK